MTHPASPERPIAKGDLVCVVRSGSCCGPDSRLGAIFRVADIEKCCARCVDCGRYGLAVHAFDAEHDDLFEVSQLNRLDPPALSESTGEPAKEVA